MTSTKKIRWGIIGPGSIAKAFAGGVANSRLGELAAIGHHAAVADIMGMKFSGFFAWWLWRTIYLMKLPGIDRKVRVALDWTLDLFFPRDIALFQSHPTRLLAEVRRRGDRREGERREGDRRSGD